MVVLRIRPGAVQKRRSPVRDVEGAVPYDRRERFCITVHSFRVAGLRAADSRPYKARVHLPPVGVDPLIDPKRYRIGNMGYAIKRPTTP